MSSKLLSIYKFFRKSKHFNPNAPLWEMPSRGDRYFRIQLSRNTSYAFVFSILLHLFLLWAFAPKLLNYLGQPPSKEEPPPLVVELSKPPAAKAEVIVPPTPEPKPAPPPPKAKPSPKVKITPQPLPEPKPQPAPPQPEVIASPKPEINNLKVPPPRPPMPDPAPQMDMQAFIKQQRERRLAAQGYTEREIADMHARENPKTESEKRDEIIQRNLNMSTGGNGIFQIREMRSRSARFSFKGWKNEYSNARLEIIDVEAGPDGDIQRAIIKKIIEIIRRDYNGDFNWESQRLGRTLVLSARLQDNAGLEDFLISEFFETPGRSFNRN